MEMATIKRAHLAMKNLVMCLNLRHMRHTPLKWGKCASLLRRKNEKWSELDENWQKWPFRGVDVKNNKIFKIWGRYTWRHQKFYNKFNGTTNSSEFDSELLFEETIIWMGISRITKFTSEDILLDWCTCRISDRMYGRVYDSVR